VHSIAVIGSHADVGVLSGGGSAQVDPPGGNAVANAGQAVFGAVVWQRSSPLKAIRAKAPHAKVEFVSGDDPAAAAKLAKDSDIAIVFVNQPSSEGGDMASLSLPGNQERNRCRQSAHHCRARDRRRRDHAVDRPRQRGSRSMVPGHPRR
jgi:beta-glucosidase